MNKSELIKQIIENNRYINKKKENPESCPCYNSNKCHNLDDDKLICFFCLCPEYNTKSVEGGCNINSKKGKWFEHSSHPTGRIWDCSDCNTPHTEGYVKKFLDLFSISELL